MCVCETCKGINCRLRTHVCVCVRVCGNSSRQPETTMAKTCLQAYIRNMLLYCPVYIVLSLWWIIARPVACEAHTHSYAHTYMLAHNAYYLLYTYTYTRIHIHLYIFLVVAHLLLFALFLLFLCSTHHLSSIVFFFAPLLGSSVWQRVHLSAGHSLPLDPHASMKMFTQLRLKA